MSNARLLFLIAVLFLGSMLWTEWQKEQMIARQAEQPNTAQPNATQAASGVASQTAAASLPSAGEVPTAAPPSATPGEVPQLAPSAPAGDSPATSVAPSGRKISFSTDVMQGEIDLAGGDINSLMLTKYRKHGGEGPVQMFSADPASVHRAQNGWVASAGVAPDHTATFVSDATSYALANGKQQIEIPLTWQDPSGVSVRKIYTLRRGSYVVAVRFEVVNNSASEWRASNYRQLQRLPGQLPSGFFVSNPETFAFTGAAVHSAELGFKKLKFDKFDSQPFTGTFAGGWSAMLQHHFISAWIPPAAELVQYSTVVVKPNGALPQRYMIRQQAPELAVAPGAKAEYQVALFAGPKLQDMIAKVAPGLELTVDYGLLTFLSKPLFWVLDLLHSVVQNWGFAIILLTLLVKLAMFKLSDAQYRSMAKMRKFQPKMQALQERYKEDRSKLSAAMMELYKTEKINPLGGCLPMLVQIPVFIALYWVIFESVELRQAPFMLWIQDLSVKDPFYVLPVLNAAIMWYTQKLTPMTGMDPMQQKVFQFLPLVMAVMLAFFPAGLVLYWCAQGGLNLLQQAYIMRKYADAK